jgi:hypothetical protein
MYLMNLVFMLELVKFAMVFIDDILLHLKSMENHEEHLRMVLQRLRSTSFMPSLASASSR